MLLRKLFVAQSGLNKLIGNCTVHQRLRQLTTQTTEKPKEYASPVPVETLLKKFSTEQTAKILDAVNNKSLKELLCYDISKARAQKLHVWRTRNGPLKDLQDILYIEGFGLKMIEKFYKSLLDEAPAVASALVKPTRSAPFFTPSAGNAQLQQIHSSVALRIGVASVTWARLSIPEQGVNAPSELTDWQHHNILDKKLHLSDLVQRCLYIDHLIPTADCYIFENPQMAQMSSNPGSVEQQNINIQKAQIQAMLSYALAARARDHRTDERVEQSEPAEEEVEVAQNKNTPGWSNVFYLRRFLTARLFNHLVGNERVSSEEAVCNLMRTHYNMMDADEATEMPDTCTADMIQSNTMRGNVQIPANLRHMFADAERFHREFLGQALLLNLAFLRLVLLQDSRSISAVARNSNKDKVDVIVP